MTCLSDDDMDSNVASVAFIRCIDARVVFTMDGVEPLALATCSAVKLEKEFRLELRLST